ncbi:3-dehydroquinate synthase [Clostridium algidicarnis]|uniref:3-dehydroquinate synthase n=1 Tax=Clostridium algidicarnis TaxID=37659 RepID=UPI001C0C4A69|nr:3-dehydroquinate synthase [Clostridium algidicarnis]MBU3203280.1 3-dehydroquinate synthase [Clostridium algidicarnis]MBU3211434.1 3-dehydroquinate synthase [Clostridium algidicarnis]MBU3222058.1 3-dehydroquinate synthase [Clostridium algidicarnis]
MYKKIEQDINVPYPIYLVNTIYETVKRIENIKVKHRADLFLIYDKNLSVYYDKYINNIRSFCKSSLYIECKECNKNRETVDEIYKFLVDNNAKRNGIVICIGGGILGDLVGFVSGTYMRGIRYINIPTTMISQVDSSIGGKVGYNFNNLKNYIGMFYNPLEVIVCPEFLKTLKRKEILSGFGEIIKYCIIDRDDLLIYFEKNIESIVNLEKDEIILLVQKCILIKRDIVSKDFKDTGLRNVLNFGHTVGHAIEIDSNYKVSHGQSVSLGILVALKLSETLMSLDKTLYNKIKDIYTYIGIDKYYKINNKDNFIKSIRGDKKNDSNIRFVLISTLGKPVIAVKVKEEQLLKVIKESIEGEKIYE